MKGHEKIKRKDYPVLMEFLSNKMAVASLVVLTLLILMAVFASYIAPYDYSKIDFTVRFQTPSWSHPLGCDEFGRDILSRIMYGARYSLAIGIVSVFLAVLMGSTIGAIAGFVGGRVDNILMRCMDIISAIPSMLMAICISAVLGNGFDKCFLAIAVSTMQQYARLLRGEILRIRNTEYLEAAASVNCSPFRIIVKHILPNCFSSVLVSATMNVGNGILMAASLSYIGLGVQPPTPEWGAMLSAARGYLRDYPHMSIMPGLAIMIVVLCLNILGDGIRDAVDPKLSH